MLYSVLISLQILAAIGLIALILLQQGKGADAGAAFGSGASSTVFGSRGSASFLTRMTALFAFVFLANSLLLAVITSRTVERTSIVEELAVPAPTDIAPDLPLDVPQGVGVADDVPADVPDVPQDLIDAITSQLPEDVEIEVSTAPDAGANTDLPPLDEALESPAMAPSDATEQGESAVGADTP
jgi:preprotein translocase subunit SecG